MLLNDQLQKGTCHVRDYRHERERPLETCAKQIGDISTPVVLNANVPIQLDLIAAKHLVLICAQTLRIWYGTMRATRHRDCFAVGRF